MGDLFKSWPTWAKRLAVLLLAWLLKELADYPQEARGEE